MTIRELMAAVGYTVRERSCHGPGRAWDWYRPGKGSMDGNQFRSEAEAWADAENAFVGEVRRAEELAGQGLLGFDPPERLDSTMAERLAKRFLKARHMAMFSGLRVADFDNPVAPTSKCRVRVVEEGKLNQLLELQSFLREDID